MGFGIYTKFKIFFGITKLENQVLNIEKSLENDSINARDAAILSISCKLSWAIKKIDNQELQIKILEDELEQARSRITTLESIPIEIGNLYNWIDIIKDNNKKLTEIVYYLKSKIE